MTATTTAPGTRKGHRGARRLLVSLTSGPALSVLVGVLAVVFSAANFQVSPTPIKLLVAGALPLAIVVLWPSAPSVLAQRPVRWLALMLLAGATIHLLAGAPISSRPLLLGAIIVAATWATHRRGWAEIQLTMMAAGATVLALSILFHLAGASRDSPGLASDGVGGLSRFGGITFHPNQLGFIAGATVILGVASLAKGVGPRWLAIASLLLGIGGMAMSQARTAVAAVLVAGGVVLGKRIIRSRWLARALVAAAAVLVVAIAALGVESINRPGAGSSAATLNGRTTIWSHAPDFILESPIVGHEPESSGPYLHELANRWEMSFRAGNFHNALLEALAEYGLIGGALLVAAATSYIRRARRWPSPTRDVVFVFVLVSAMTEALFFSLDYGYSCSLRASLR